MVHAPLAPAVARDALAWNHLLSEVEHDLVLGRMYPLPLSDIVSFKSCVIRGICGSVAATRRAVPDVLETEIDGRRAFGRALERIGVKGVVRRDEGEV